MVWCRLRNSKKRRSHQNDRYNILRNEASYISETLASARQGTKASIIIDKRQKVYVKRNSNDKHDYTGYMYKGKSK